MAFPSDPHALHEQVWPEEDFPSTTQGFPVFPYPTEADLARAYARTPEWWAELMAADAEPPVVVQGPGPVRWDWMSRVDDDD